MWRAWGWKRRGRVKSLCSELQTPSFSAARLCKCRGKSEAFAPHPQCSKPWRRDTIPKRTPYLSESPRGADIPGARESREEHCIAGVFNSINLNILSCARVAAVDIGDRYALLTSVVPKAASTVFIRSLRGFTLHLL